MGNLLFTWLQLVMSLMVSSCAVLFLPTFALQCKTKASLIFQQNNSEHLVIKL